MSQEEDDGFVDCGEEGEVPRVLPGCFEDHEGFCFHAVCLVVSVAACDVPGLILCLP